MLHKILLEVATSHLRDFGSARIAFSGFNQIGREEYFYRSEDLFNLNDWIDEANALRTFRLRCYQAGNLEAIYIRGMYEFFVLHLLDEGREKIRLAGERGLLWAKYVDGILNLAFSVDARGFVHNYPSFSREFVDQMNLHDHDFVIEPVFVVSLDGSRTRWTCNRCFWQCAAWDFCNDIHLTAGHWPIKD
uniref:At2g35280-like TPR domain-containing protein n=1 Tax=Brassica oleracea var. oleracea TaxID=109376 RepID=A0A0D3AP93_BRAOL